MTRILVLLVLLSPILANSQTTDCPSARGCVTITREAAEKALLDADKVIALEKENKTLTEALNAQREIAMQIRIQFATVSGENTILKQNEVRSSAERVILIQNTRKKCFPFAICLN